MAGWPWRTTVALRLRVTARLADGSGYDNTVCQWLTLRWGAMTRDFVLEDTERLSRALDIQARQHARPAPRPN